MSAPELIKTVYLCSGARTALEVIDADSRQRSIVSVIEGAEAEYTIPLAPVGLQEEIGVNVVAGMLGTTASWADKYPRDFKLKLVSDAETAPFWISGIRFEYDIPPGCDWQKSELLADLSAPAFNTLEPLIAPGEIPDSKSDVSMVTDWTASVVSSIPVIGQRIDLQHSYRVAPGVNIGPLYFRTQHFTGGVVIARRAHPAIANLLVYDIQCEDQPLLTDILPTDYFLYDIGDNVFPFVVGDARTTLEPSFPFGSFRIAPLQLDGIGVPFGLSFSTFSEYANLRVLVGSVVSVSESVNTATVLINGSSYNLDIVYHCVSQSTADARTAFKAGDSVLVLWSGYKSSLSAVDMVIIGHQGYVYPCVETTTTTTSTTSTTTTSTTSSSSTTTTAATTSTTLQLATSWTVAINIAPGRVTVPTFSSIVLVNYYQIFVFGTPAGASGSQFQRGDGYVFGGDSSASLGLLVTQVSSEFDPSRPAEPIKYAQARWDGQGFVEWPYSWNGSIWVKKDWAVETVINYARPPLYGNVEIDIP